ncbi:MAG TPA: hypothetical protein VLQ91_22090 [Draconibacterium sp.]|nr:hypothetical protein [Draconibacterium sp.]
MATYDKCIHNLPAYQEGNEADFEFDLDANFPLNEVSDISFQVRNAKGRLIIPEKTLLTNTLTLTGRTVIIPFSAEEMKGNADKHQYEIDFLNIAGKPFATIGGAFPINAETNTK